MLFCPQWRWKLVNPTFFVAQSGSGAAGFATLFATSLFDISMILPSTVAVAALAIVPYVSRFVLE